MRTLTIYRNNCKQRAELHQVLRMMWRRGIIYPQNVYASPEHIFHSFMATHQAYASMGILYHLYALNFENGDNEQYAITTARLILEQYFPKFQTVASMRRNSIGNIQVALLVNSISYLDGSRHLDNNNSIINFQYAIESLTNSEWHLVPPGTLFNGNQDLDKNYGSYSEMFMYE